MDVDQVEHTRPSGGRLLGVLVLLGVSALLMLGAVTAGWLKTQLLDTDTFVETNQQALEDPEVRTALATTLVDTAYDAADPQQRLESALPPRLDPLAAPVASALRPAAYDATERALATTQFSDLWANINRATHERLMAVVDGTAPVVASDAGQVTVDLRALVNQVAARLGIGPFEGDRIPESVTTVALPQSENMANTIDLMRRLDRLGLWLGLIGVAGFAAAIALSRGFRRRAVTYWGAFIVFAGLVLHVNIALGRDWVPAQITDTPAWQRAYTSIYDLYTQQLSLAANTLLLVGAIVLLSTWLLGDSRAALASRRRSAPVLREHALASWVGFAIVLYAMFTWLPALSSRSAQGAVLLLVLATVGFWALRRELVRQTPFPATAGTPNWVPADAGAEATAAVDARSKVEIAPKRVDDVASSDESSDALDAIPDELREIADPIELDRFERLTALRDREVLSTEEYDAARELLIERLERRVARQSRQPAPGGD